MTETRLIMGMPVRVDIADAHASKADLDAAFAYFARVDERFSTYKKDSEISKINRGELQSEEWSPDMREVMALCEETRQKTNGYFNIRRPDGTLDPSGLVKGWAIRGAAALLTQRGFKNFYVDAGGDIQTEGHNAKGLPWSIGIRHPHSRDEIVKVLYPHNRGVATSGIYVRGLHIYDPHSGAPAQAFMSLTVIGPDIYEADRFATAAFAMGAPGLQFLESLPGFEAYAINESGRATMTSGFGTYTHA